MWSVVCADNEDTSVIECLAQGFTVALRLDGRIAFDTGATCCIVSITEKEMGDGGFGGDI
jgi:hypothetical protein